MVRPEAPDDADANHNPPEKALALIGTPTIYAPMGFASNGLLHSENLDTEIVQDTLFSGAPPQGTLKFALAFDLGNSGH